MAYYEVTIKHPKKMPSIQKAKKYLRFMRTKDTDGNHTGKDDFFCKS